jgi:hypothetical protein
MDWIIEKAVEMGVAAIQPLAAQRCVVRLAGERAEKRQAHWQAVIVAASEQSGRNRLARLAPMDNFSGWIGQSDLHKRVLLTPRARQSLPDWARHQPPQALTCWWDRKAAVPNRKKTRRSRAAQSLCRWGRASCAPRPRRWPLLLRWEEFGEARERRARDGDLA